MRIGHGLANFMRGSVRCMFPLTTILLWTGLLLVPQGTDVLRSALERAARLHSVNDLAYLWVASGLLGLSLWYSMRWLITAELPALRFTLPVSEFWRDWAPRAGGAFAPGLVVVVLGWPGTFAGVDYATLAWTIVAFLALAIGLLVFFWERHRVVASMAETPGRDVQGRPGFLPIAQRLPDGTVGVIVWSIVLTVLLGALFSMFALTAPRVVGAAALAAIALASINLFGSFALTWLPMRNALPPLGPWLLLWAILISPLADNHGGAARDAIGTATPPALTVAQAFDAWSGGLAADDTAPVYIVAAEGGGIRAAYWAAAVLQSLQDAVPHFADHVFALSSVSGGSVGVSTWAASVRAARCPDPASTATAVPLRATDMLAADFVSPALAGLFYYDFGQRFVPIPMTTLDRSRGLEEGMQRAGYRLSGRPFEKTLAEFYEGCPHLPELLLNATVVETGQRAILSRLDTRDFIDAFRLPPPAGASAPAALVGNGSIVTSPQLELSRQTLAQLTHHSARFPLISPLASIRALPAANAGLMAQARARWWPDIRMRLGDGGYFENSGLLTALETLRQIKSTSARKVKLIIITSDDAVAAMCGVPSGDKTCPDPAVPRPQDAPDVLRWLHEVVPVAEALYLVRDSRLHITAAQAIDTYQHEVIMLPMPQARDGLKAPLGWALSAQVRRDLYCGAPDVVAERLPVSAVLPMAEECKHAR